MSSTNEEYTLSEDAMLIKHSSTWMSVRIAVLNLNMRIRELARVGKSIQDMRSAAAAGDKRAEELIKSIHDYAIAV